MKNVTYISAGAGSGKTYTLTKTLAKLIKNESVDPASIILTTFTNKAAEDFKERSKEMLYKEGMYEAASLLDNALIGTIHSIAMKFIGKYWFFLGLSPSLTTITEDDAAQYQAQSLGSLPTVQEIGFLKKFAREFEIKESYLAGGKTYNIDYNFWMSHLSDIIKMSTNYSVKSYDKSRLESKKFFEALIDTRFSEPLPRGKKLEELIVRLKNIPGAESEQSRKKLLEELWKNRKYPTLKYYEKIGKFIQKMGKKMDNFPDLVALGNKYLNVWQSPQVFELISEYIDLVFNLAERWRVVYSLFKKENNLLDFNDQEKYFYELLTIPQCAAEISKEFQYVLVDEFQDSSPIQVKIFERLSYLVKHSYWVGDAKQAIYGFRGSDTELTDTIASIIENSKQYGNSSETLSISYRSVPEIVECCNKMFVKVFSKFSEMDKDRITLSPSKVTDPEVTPLVVWVNVNPQKICNGIADMIAGGINPSDIAVLDRKQSNLNNLAVILEKNCIPVNREGLKLKDSVVTLLTSAVLDVTDNEANSVAKASIGFLTEKGLDTETIMARAMEFTDEKDRFDLRFLDSIPLVKRIGVIRSRLRHQSFARFVESVILETNLYEVAKKCAPGNEAERVLDTVILEAEKYEESCIRLGVVPTVAAFNYHISEDNINLPGNGSGVNLVTIHSAKGLQWKYVIVTSLDRDVSNPHECIKREIFGVHFHYLEKPSAQNLYPEVFLTLLPFVYGSGNTYPPGFICNALVGKPEFEKILEKNIFEEARLLYVAFTRPSQCLILTEESKKQPFKWLEVSNIIDGTSVAELIDNYGFTPQSLREGEEGVGSVNEDSLDFTYVIPESMDKFLPRDYSPSRVSGIKEVKDSFDFGFRIPFGELPAGFDEADLGNCIHNIFQAFESFEPTEEAISEIISQHALTSTLPHPGKIVRSWHNLIVKIAERHGPVKSHRHETPFYLYDGTHIFSGSIDLVVETSQGTVLIDFKSCPMGGKVLDKTSPHYAGKYGGQLGCYQAALTKSRRRPIASYIYYPISGLLVELNMD